MPHQKSITNSERLALEGPPLSKALSESRPSKDMSKDGYKFVGIEEDDDHLTYGDDKPTARAIEWKGKDATHPSGALVTREKPNDMVSRREASREKRKERSGKPGQNEDKVAYNNTGIAKPKTLEAGLPERKVLELGSAAFDEGYDAGSQALVPRDKLGGLERRGHSRSQASSKHRSRREHGNRDDKTTDRSSRKPREIEGVPTASRRKELTYEHPTEEAGNEDKALVFWSKQAEESVQLVQTTKREVQGRARSKALGYETEVESGKPRETKAGRPNLRRKELTYSLGKDESAPSGALVRTVKDDSYDDTKAKKTFVHFPELDGRKLPEIEAGSSVPKRKELTYTPDPEMRKGEDAGALVQSSKRGSEVDKKSKESKQVPVPNEMERDMRKPRELEAGPPRSKRKELTHESSRAPSPSPPSEDEAPSDSNGASTSNSAPPRFEAKGKGRALPEPGPQASGSGPNSDSGSDDYRSHPDDDKVTRKWKRDMRKYQAAMITYERQQAREREIGADGGQLIRARSPSPKRKDREHRRRSPSPEYRDRVVARRRRGDVVQKTRYETETEIDSDSDEEYEMISRKKEREVRRKKKEKKKSKPVPQPININLSNVNNVTL